jgi:hypothetical protein
MPHAHQMAQHTALVKQQRADVYETSAGTTVSERAWHGPSGSETQHLPSSIGILLLFYWPPEPPVVSTSPTNPTNPTNPISKSTRSTQPCIRPCIITKSCMCRLTRASNNSDESDEVFRASPKVYIMSRISAWNRTCFSCWPNQPNQQPNRCTYIVK